MSVAKVHAPFPSHSFEEPDDDLVLAAGKLSDEKIETISLHMREIMLALGLDISDPNLAGTDRRVARMYLEMFAGLESDTEPSITTFPNDEGYSEMVMIKEIPFYSMCAHHFVPFFGQAHIAYIPKDRIVGLSKIARIVEFYGKRPQLQERLTEQVADCLTSRLQPQGAMVVIEAQHLCMEMRGVKKPGAMTVTSSIRGCFEQKPTREEFLDLLKLRRS